MRQREVFAALFAMGLAQKVDHHWGGITVYSVRVTRITRSVLINTVALEAVWKLWVLSAKGAKCNSLGHRPR